MTAQRPGIRTRIFALELFPVVRDVNQLTGEVVRPLGSKKQGKIDLLARRHSAGKSDLLGFFHFPRTGKFIRAQNFVGHARVGEPRRKAIDLYVVVSYLFRDTLHKSNYGGFTRGERREVRSRIRRRLVGDSQDLPASALDHLRQNETAGVHCADDVGLKDLLPVPMPLVHERSYGAKYGGVRHEHMHVAVNPGHALDRGGKLLEIPYICPKTVRSAAGVFDFKLGYVEFALAAANEANPDPGVSKPDCEPFPDSPPGASDQRGHVLVRVQKFILPPDLVYAARTHAARIEDPPSAAPTG